MQPLLHIENLSISFRGEEGKTEAVKNISLNINKGEILALVGESGSGKSVTALSVLQLLPTPPAEYSGGKILFTDGNKKPGSPDRLGWATMEPATDTRDAIRI